MCRGNNLVPFQVRGMSRGSPSNSVKCVPGVNPQRESAPWSITSGAMATVAQLPHVFVSACVGGCTVTIARKNLDYDEVEQDVYLFEPDYTIAGSTGFLLWPGTWVLIDLLNQQAGPLGPRLHGRRAIELGSGTGLAGLCAAAAGCHVLLTDLPSVVHGILDGNVRRNNAATAKECPPLAEVEVVSMACTTSQQLQQDGPIGAAISPISSSSGTAPLASSFSPPWPGSVAVGGRGGSACCSPLDWSEPLQPQLDASLTRQGLDLASAYVLLACDVVWLKELLHPFRWGAWMG